MFPIPGQHEVIDARGLRSLAAKTAGPSAKNPQSVRRRLQLGLCGFLGLDSLRIDPGSAKFACGAQATWSRLLELRITAVADRALRSSGQAPAGRSKATDSVELARDVAVACRTTRLFKQRPAGVGMKNVGPTRREWRDAWFSAREKLPPESPHTGLPLHTFSPMGYHCPAALRAK